MGLLQISREIKSVGGQSMVPSKNLAINIDDYLKLVDNKFWHTIIDNCEVDGVEFKYAVSRYKLNKKELFSLTFSEGQISISYDGKLKDEIITVCHLIALELDAYLLSDVNIEYPHSKIIAAQKRLAKKTKILEVEYQKESFGGNNMWLAIRSDLNRVKSYFNLEGKETEWQKGIDTMSICEGIFMYEFRSWVFLAGQNLGSLFAPYPKGEKAIETYQVEQLKDWGKEFNDIQLYMHYNRSMYFNAFYRVLNGRLVYGEYETESHQKKYGKIPKELKELPDNNANTVAMEWSYDPDYLRYQEELENAKTWIVTVKKIS